MTEGVSFTSSLPGKGTFYKTELLPSAHFVRIHLPQGGRLIGTTAPKAPSQRELSPEVTEGVSFTSSLPGKGTFYKTELLPSAHFVRIHLPQGGRLIGTTAPKAPSQRELSPEVTEGVSLHQGAQQPQHTVQHRAGQAGAAFRHLYLAALRQRGPYIVPQNCHLTVLLQQYTALKV